MYQKPFCHSERSEESLTNVRPTSVGDPSLIAQDDRKCISYQLKGFVAITTVLILSAVVVAIAISVSLLSIGEAQSSLSLYKGEDNLSFVEGCIEDVMLKIRANSSYNGTSITRPEGTCSITYNTGGPTNWDLTVTSGSLTYQRRINVIFVRNPTGITLTSWKEI